MLTQGLTECVGGRGGGGSWEIISKHLFLEFAVILTALEAFPQAAIKSTHLQFL